MYSVRDNDQDHGVSIDEKLPCDNPSGIPKKHTSFKTDELNGLLQYDHGVVWD
jgi:hypothetical protein